MNPSNDGHAGDKAHDAQAAENNERLAGALQRYMAELEEGRLPDRRKLLSEYPEIEEELAASLASLDFIHHVAPEMQAEASADPLLATNNELTDLSLGDFTILREIGRGGMGIVYEAQQKSLGRRVALKVLPFAALMDPRQIQRFKNEAKAAATLHHTNIVPVHSVGCERGIHYFAMQFIEGPSLEVMLWRLREATQGNTRTGEAATQQTDAAQRCEPNRPAPRTDVDTQPINALTTAYSRDRNGYFRQAARLAMDAAEALDHAHAQGVIHRDIKPANLLLDVDGRVWVTDFGLARLDTETGITMTGDVMGTLRYMSPEQAAGKRHVIDPRCDIYSLGVTLYELLTLRPTFDSNDRPRLLRQIAEQEPRRLRAIDPSIPPDLETIVLKALQKSPGDRYDTAQELADDLRRFLEQKAIQAKRPTRFTQAVRWSRRHFEALAAVAVVLIISLIVAGGFSASAYRQEVRQRERAEANLQLAKETVDTMYTRFAEEWLSQDAANSDAQREFLERAVAFYEQLSDREAIDPATQFDIAQTKIRVGRMYHWLGGEERLKLAERRLNEALSILKGIAPHYDNERDFQYVLAWCHYELQEMIGKGQEADQQGRLQHLRNSRGILTTHLDKVDNDDEARDLLAGVIGRQGRIRCTTGEFDEAKKLFVEARQVAEQIEDETARLRAIAVCDEMVVRLPPSHYPNQDREKAAVRVVEYWRTVQAANPRDANAQHNLANSLNGLASLRFNSNTRVEEGLLNLIEAAQTLTGVVEQAPAMDNARTILISWSWNLRLFPERLGLDEPRWREVVGVQQQILEACSEREDRLAAVAPLLCSLDGLARSLAERGELSKALETADEFWELALQQVAVCAEGSWPSPSYEIALANMRLCEVFVKHEQPAAAYRHSLAIAEYAHLGVQAASATPVNEKQQRDRLLDGFLGTSKVYQLVVNAWGSEALMAACRDAVSRNEFGPDELWPLQIMAEIDTGNTERALTRVTPLLELESQMPLEALLYVLGIRLNSVDENYRPHAIRLHETLIDTRQAHLGENVWQVPTFGAMAHAGLSDAYAKMADWPGAAQHGRLVAQLVMQAVDKGESDFRGNDARGLGSDHAMKSANAYFHLRELDESKQMATVAIKLLAEILKDSPSDHGQRRNLSQAFFQLAEAEYFADCNEQAQRAYDNSVQNLREQLANDLTDHELEDHQKLCGMLTRYPFSMSAATEEVQELSLRLQKLAPDDPVVWHEVAWVEYRCGNLESARSSYLRFLESSEANDEQLRMALVGCALAEYGLGNEDAARDYFRRVVEAFEQAPDETVFGIHEHSTLTEVAKKLQQEDIVVRTFADQFKGRPVDDL